MDCLCDHDYSRLWWYGSCYALGQRFWLILRFLRSLARIYHGPCRHQYIWNGSCRNLDSKNSTSSQIKKINQNRSFLVHTACIMESVDEQKAREIRFKKIWESRMSIVAYKEEYPKIVNSSIKVQRRKWKKSLNINVSMFWTSFFLFTKFNMQYGFYDLFHEPIKFDRFRKYAK